MCSERVMRELGIKEIQPEVMVLAPRRLGKSVAVSLFVLALLLNCPGIRICIFSTGKRASSNLMTEIMDRLAFVEGGRDRVVKNNQEQLFIAQTSAAKGLNVAAVTKMQNDASTSRLYSFPGGTSS